MNPAIPRSYDIQRHPLLALMLVFGFLTGPTVASGSDAIADADISAKVDGTLLLDSAIPYHAIDVRTNDGIVTLSGKVTNVLAQQRAARLAKTVRGVRAVINQLEVDPIVDRSPQQLRDAVKDALFYDAATESYEVDVAADAQGQVTLTGTVSSWQESDLAETVAKGVNGVTSVANRLRVEPRLERADAEIKPEIEKRLHWDVMVDDGLIDVQVDNGKVTLSGTVGSAAEKHHATVNAWVGGVTSVDSSGLKVARWARDDDLRRTKYVKKPDADIRSAIKDAMLFDPRVHSFDIDVKVENGLVTLAGIVGNAQARKAAERDAQNTVGVVGVTNLIKVRPGATVDAKTLAERIRAALARNPFTESHEIDVRVRGHVAHLTGIVDTYFEKAEAERVALGATGVTDVRNKLVVGYPDRLGFDPYVDTWLLDDYPWYVGPPRVQRKSDWRITRDIEDELMWSPYVDGDDVDVSVSGGVATLSGTVDSWSEFNAARENAFEGGAVAVINRIEVR